MEKEYIIGQLEKKLADEAYYRNAPQKTKRRVSDEMSLLIEGLLDQKFEKKEKRLFMKALNFVQKIQRVIK